MDPDRLMNEDVLRRNRYPNCAASRRGKSYPCADCGRERKWAGPACPAPRIVREGY